MATILDTLRRKGKYWLGRFLARGTRAAADLQTEKTKPKAGGIGYLSNLPWFLPYTSNTSDPRALRYVYRQMTQEPTIKAALHQKAMAVASLDLQVIPASDSKRDEEIANFCKWTLLNLRGGYHAWVIRSVLGALTDGWDIGEKLCHYREREPWGGRWTIYEIAQRDNHQLEPEYDAIDGTYLGIRENTSAEVIDPAWLVVLTYLDLYQNVMGQSDLWAAYRDYYLLDTALKLRNIALDRWTLPILMGTYSQPNDRPMIEATLRQARAMGWFSVRDDIKIEALKIAQSGTSDFEAAINSLRQSILQGITLAYLQSSEGTTTGARSMGEVHADIAELPVWYLAVLFANVINTQIFQDLVDLNYAQGGRPTAVLGGINVETLIKELPIWQGAKAMGVPLSLAAFYARFNLAKPTSDEDTMKGGDAAPPPGGGLPFADDSRGKTARRHVADEAQYRQQTNFTCGPAALRYALVELMGQPEIEEEELARRLEANPDHGTTMEAMVDYATQQGLMAHGAPGAEYGDLIDATANGQPVLCALQAWGSPSQESALQSGHWVVVQEATPSGVLLFDPAEGHAEWTHGEFLDRWIDIDRGDVVPHLAMFLAEGSGAEFAAEDWVPYEGKHGGRGWQNVKSGNIVYGMKDPGGEAKAKEGETKKDDDEEGKEGAPIGARKKAGGDGEEHLSALESAWQQRGPEGKAARQQAVRDAVGDFRQRVNAEAKGEVGRVIADPALKELDRALRDSTGTGLKSAVREAYSQAIYNQSSRVQEALVESSGQPFDRERIGQKLKVDVKQLRRDAWDNLDGVEKEASWIKDQDLEDDATEKAAMRRDATRQHRLRVALGKAVFGGAKPQVEDNAEPDDGVLESETQVLDADVNQVSQEDLEKKDIPEEDPEFHQGPDTALAGADGRQLDKLMQGAKLEAVGKLSGVFERIIRRVLQSSAPESTALAMKLDAAEENELANLTATISTTGEMFGRAIARERAKQANVSLHVDEPTNLRTFADPIFLPDSPEAAVAYFKSLVPTLGVDPRSYVPGIKREAFSMAYVSNLKLLRRVQKIILEELEKGGVGAIPSVQMILKKAGIHPANPQYAEMVVRTNLNDSYTQGITEEIRDDAELQDAFPVWQYVGIKDGRQGKDHEPKFDRYYSSALSFAQVRGARVWNCRCAPQAVTAREWADLQAGGTRLSTID